MREGLCLQHSPNTVKFSWASATHRWLLKPAECCSCWFSYWELKRDMRASVLLVCFLKAAASALQVSCKSQRTRLAACKDTPCQGQGRITKRHSRKTVALSHSTLQRKCATKCLFKHKLLKAPGIWIQLISMENLHEESWAHSSIYQRDTA